jgi:hypothetical protein
LTVLVALTGAGAPPASGAASGAPVLLWLGPFDTGALDSAALLEAVSVYTRDLSLETRMATEIPPPSPAARAAGRDAAAGAALRAHGARLGFWCEPAPDAKTTALITIDVDGRLEVRVVDGAALGGPELYRAIALKLRAMLAATIGPEAVAVPGAPAAPPPPTTSPAAPPPPSVSLTSPTAPVAATPPTATVVAVAPPPARDNRRFFSALGYRISTPFGSGSFQQGITAEAGARLGRAGELALGLAVETRAADSAVIGSVSVFDLPLAAEARWVRRGRRLSWGGGGFLAAHLLWSTADSAGGARQTSFDLGGGVGVEALARGALGGGVAAEARLYAELPVPRTRYLVGDTPVLALGPRFGVGVALVFSAL